MRTKRATGFSLIELLVTLAVLGVMATIVLPMAQIEAQRTKEQSLRAALRELRSGIDAYKLATDQGRIRRESGTSGFPPNLQALVQGVEDLSDPRHGRLYFLRRIPRDPLNADASVPDAATWGLRSYASSPDEPSPGDDVFDVYTLAPGQGLNGIAYRNW